MPGRCFLSVASEAPARRGASCKPDGVWGIITSTITKDTILGDILDAAPETAPLFIEIGMHCLGCPSARSETVEQACYVHGQDVDALLAKLNAAIAGK